MEDQLIEGQISYYRARAPEYEEWFLRQGRHDLGHELNRRWRSELDHIRESLADFGPAGEVLELACGTGLWTVELARYADGITAVDASSEALEINRRKLEDAPVRYVRANLFDWRPDDAYDAVFFGFWLSHVPPERFVAFWELVRSSLKPGGRVFFVDSLRPGTSEEENRSVSAPGDHTVLRQLNDGSEFRIVKVFYDPRLLEDSLGDLGWNVRVHTTENLLYGLGERR